MNAIPNNENLPLVSICIPYYHQPDLLKISLNSIANQDYKNFEVIITDDSNDIISSEIISNYSGKIQIKYYKNDKNLGSPKNWNHALTLSSGSLIILQHQDDYFKSNTSLSKFVNALSHNDVQFAFGKIEPIDKENIILKIPTLISKLKSNPELILTTNIIGPPSNIIFRASLAPKFDENLIWAVDYEMYYNWLKKGHQFTYVDEQLVEIGRHDHQITKYCDENPFLKLNENIYVFNKHKEHIKMNIRLYDFYFRMLRNNKITNPNLKFKSPITDLPYFMRIQIKAQNIFGYNILKIGLFSKSIMFICWIIYQFTQRRSLNATKRK